MPMRALLLSACLVLSAVGSAQVQTFRIDGNVDFASTQNILGQAQPPSVVQTGIPVGSEFSLTFSYDQSEPIVDQYLDVTEYDAPFSLTGRLGDRTFTGTASLVLFRDNLPGEGEDQFRLFINELVYGNSTTYTPQIFTEDNPFSNSDFYLNDIGILLTDSTGTAFPGNALPSTLNLSAFDSALFTVSYLDLNVASDDSDDVSTDFQGTIGGVTQINAVPEPATMAVLGLGAAAMLRRRRKA